MWASFYRQGTYASFDVNFVLFVTSPASLLLMMAPTNEDIDVRIIDVMERYDMFKLKGPLHKIMSQ